MAFEQDTRQQHKEELEQLQRMEENRQFQEELDTIIARLENKQFQKDLDTIIERLDHESQQPHSSKKEIFSHESITEEEPVQLSSLEKTTQTFDNQFISHHEENTKEQATENKNLEKIEKSMQEKKQPPLNRHL